MTGSPLRKSASLKNFIVDDKKVFSLRNNNNQLQPANTQET